jgi:hypothetical protein
MIGHANGNGRSVAADDVVSLDSVVAHVAHDFVAPVAVVARHAGGTGGIVGPIGGGGLW